MRLNYLFQLVTNKYVILIIISIQNLNIGYFKDRKIDLMKGLLIGIENFKKLIDKNYQLLVDYINQNIPQIKVYPLQGTYLAWLDFRNLGYDHHELEKKMINANLYLDEGYLFGEEGKGFERINIACPTNILLESLKRLKKEFA